MNFRIILFLIFIILAGCSSAQLDFSKFSPDEIAELSVVYKSGMKFTTTKIFTSSEELEDKKTLTVYRYEKYVTEIKGLDSEQKPVAGSRQYLEAFYELTSGESVKRNASKFAGKTIYFKPDQPPTIDDSDTEKEEAETLRLTGFEDLFLPEKIVKNNTEIVYQLPDTKIEQLKHFLRLQGILPDKSEIFIKLHEIKESEGEKMQNDVSLRDWKFNFRWNVSGLLLSAQPRGIRLELKGIFIYSEKLSNITYFELRKDSSKNDNSSFTLQISREFAEHPN